MLPVSLRAACALALGGLSAFAQETFNLRTYNLVPPGANPTAPVPPATASYGNGNWNPMTPGNDVTYEGFQLGANANSSGSLVFNFSAPRNFQRYERFEVTVASLPGNALGTLTLELQSRNSDNTLRRSNWAVSTSGLTRHGDKLVFNFKTGGTHVGGLPADLAAIRTVILRGDAAQPPVPTRLIIREISAIETALCDPLYFTPSRILGFGTWADFRTPQGGALMLGAGATNSADSSFYFRYVNSAAQVADERDLTPYQTFAVTARALSGNQADLRLELRSTDGGMSHWTLPRASFASATPSTVPFDLRTPANSGSPTPANLSRISGMSISALGNLGTLNVRWSIGAIDLAPSTPTAFTFRRGLNISHWMSQLSGSLQYNPDRLSPALLQHIQSLVRVGEANGPRAFDHVRLPIDYDKLGTLDTATNPPTYVINLEQAGRVSDAIRWASDRGLGTILDLHKLPGLALGDPNGASNPLFTGDASTTSEAYVAQAAIVWQAVAQHFANVGPELRFELMNEPRHFNRWGYGSEHSEDVALVQEVLREEVRKISPKRVIYITTNNRGFIGTFYGAQKSQPGHTAFGVFPQTPTPEPIYGWDDNIAYTIHFYEPQGLTHFGMGTNTVKFTASQIEAALGANSADANSVHARFDKLRADITNTIAPNSYLRQYREIHIGEFGITKEAARQHGDLYPRGTPNTAEYHQSIRAHFMYRVRVKAEQHGFAWCAWDYLNDEFSLFDRTGTATPVPNSAGVALLKATPPTP